MRLLIVGTLKGQLTTATKIAMENGASVTHAEAIEQAMAVLRGGKGADLLLVDVALDIRDLVMRLEAEHIHVPIVACGISNDARAAVAAIHAGAKEYIPLPPDPELIAAVLAAVANDSRDLVYRQEAVHINQLRGDSRASAGIRIVRPREGRVHRRHRAADRKIRGSHRRHAAIGRNLGNGRAAAIQVAARNPGTRDRPGRRYPAGAGGYPDHRDLEPQPGRRRARRQLPRRPAVPAQCREPEDTAAARTCGGYSRTGAAFRQEIFRGQR